MSVGGVTPKEVGNSAQPDPLDPVEALFDQLSRLVDSLKLTGEPSLAVSVSEIASKSLLLAAASRFEAEFTRLFTEVASVLSTSEIANFCINQGVIRKYHTLFDWEANNVNRFLKLFGDDFRDRALARVSTDQTFSDAVVAFVVVGAGRNRLVHSDFATFPLEDTLEELIEKYRRARYFLPVLHGMLLETPQEAEDS
jgi:hypothetical protein